MSMRRKFSEEFKRGAVEQASRPGVSCAQVARELGIRDNLLTRWKRDRTPSPVQGLRPVQWLHGSATQIVRFA